MLAALAHIRLAHTLALGVRQPQILNRTKLRDTFPYEARWDSVGLDCSNCVHFRGPPQWPDVHRVSCCGLHKRSLAIELLSSGYKGGEWFCRDFRDDGSAFPKAAVHFAAEQARLVPEILYSFYGTDGELGETEFRRLPAVCDAERPV